MKLQSHKLTYERLQCTHRILPDRGSQQVGPRSRWALHVMYQMRTRNPACRGIHDAQQVQPVIVPEHTNGIVTAKSTRTISQHTCAHRIGDLIRQRQLLRVNLNLDLQHQRKVLTSRANQGRNIGIGVARG